MAANSEYVIDHSENWKMFFPVRNEHDPILMVNRNFDKEKNRVCRQLATYVSSFVDVRENITYNLISVICRTNSAVQSGHFVSLVKDWYTDKWYKFDDKIVSSCTNPFQDSYRHGAVYLCYASSAALEKTIQNYEETFEKFSDKFFVENFVKIIVDPHPDPHQRKKSDADPQHCNKT